MDAFAFVCVCLLLVTRHSLLRELFDTNSVGPTRAHMQIFDPIPLLFPICSSSECAMRMSMVCVIKCLIQIAMHLDRTPNKFNDFSFFVQHSRRCRAQNCVFSSFGSAVVSRKFGLVNANRRGALTISQCRMAVTICTPVQHNKKNTC